MKCITQRHEIIFQDTKGNILFTSFEYPDTATVIAVLHEWKEDLEEHGELSRRLMKVKDSNGDWNGLCYYELYQRRGMVGTSVTMPSPDRAWEVNQIIQSTILTLDLEEYPIPISQRVHTVLRQCASADCESLLQDDTFDDTGGYCYFCDSIQKLEAGQLNHIIDFKKTESHE